MSIPTDAVRPMVAADALEAARLHAEYLPHGLFPQLGTRFLRRYYQTFLASPAAVALVTGAPGAPTGVLVGVLAPRQHLEWVVRHHGARLAFAGLGALVLRPRLWRNFVRRRLPRYARALRSILSRRSHARPSEPASATAAAGVLSHIVVSPAGRRGGTGAGLVAAFLADARRAGVQRVRATTLGGPDGAAAFYERTGWERQSESTDWDARTIVLFERSTGISARSE